MMEETFFLDFEEQLSVPLYKYYGNLEYAKDVINNHRIHFESPEDYNDIFDCTTYIKDDELINLSFDTDLMLSIFKMCINDEEKNDFDKYIAPSFNIFGTIKATELFDQFFYLFPNVEKSHLLNILRTVMGLNNIIVSGSQKVSCFSENKDSLLMWSYYANSHKGVCLEFDIKKDKSLSKHCHKVQYTQHFDIGNSTYKWFSKSEQWQHEQEWRIVQYGSEYLSTDTLRAIYMGFKMNSDEKTEFINLGEKYKLDVYIVSPSQTKYELEFLQILKNGEIYIKEVK